MNQWADECHIFCLHFLGGSSDTWDQVREKIPPRLPFSAFDLPGFGRANDQHGSSVEEMSKGIAEQIRLHRPRRWMLVGHSMGAKIAAVIARWAEDGESGLSGLVGVVLVAGSPPSPEPMQDTQRQTMLDWFQSGMEVSRRQADTYIDENSGEPLAPELKQRAVEDVLRANKDAWRLWLRVGSREDWSGRVGRIASPTLILAGSKDQGLGEDAQVKWMAPHFKDHRLEICDGAGHLIPLERPTELARSIEAFALAGHRDSRVAAIQAPP
jgi:pimeloyl-ACP methyl ester carboxylesterase